MHNGVPTGTVTFLFTDIEGSTRLAQEQGTAWESLRQRHGEILTAALQSEGGFVFEVIGDAFCAAFHAAADAIGAAARAQQDLNSELWGNALIRVRMGIHTGEAKAQEGHYRGYLALGTVQRVMSAAHGGQVLLSEAAFQLVQDELPPGVTTRDLGQHRLTDLQRPQRLVQLVIPNLPSEFPPPRTLDLHPHNLPVLLSSFVGRRSQVAEVRQLLGTQRLVTLVGPGGFGKTRLALEVAGESLPGLEDGTWLVQLGSLTDPSLVAQTVASAVGAREQAGRTIIETLSDYLHSKRLLLVLDNCEHLVEACAEFATAALQACPSLIILATSLEPLGVDGEVVWNVPPLSLPQRSSPMPGVRGQDVSQAEAPSESVQLFVARAQTAAPAFTLTTENMRAVDEICRRLDGMPLAIELAASRLRALSAEEIAAHLDDRFQLLTGGSRTAPARHRTLEATLDWSYALLSEAERKVLRRLCVFAGGCTLQAAEAVCSAEDVSTGEVLDLLLRLVDKSLVVTEVVEGKSRYYLLETIREYARGRLAASGGDRTARDRHLEYFVTWAEKAAPLLPRAAHADWLGLFDHEHDNVRAALDWSFATSDGAQAGLRLAAAAGIYWRLRGFPREGRDRLTAVLAREDAQAPTAARARALDHLAVFRFFESEYASVRALVDESIAIWEDQGSEGRLGVAWGKELLAEIEAETGNYQAAFPLFEEALVLFREVQDPTGTADTVKMTGWTAMRAGNYDMADAYLSEGLELCRQSGDRHHVASALSGLGELAIRRGQLERAQQLLEESLEIARSIGDKWEMPIALGSLGWVALRGGDLAKASSLLAESLRIRAETNDRGGMAWCLEKLAHGSLRHGQFARATALFGAAHAIRASVDSQMDEADRPEYEQDLSALRSALAREAFQAQWDHGHRMPVPEVIDFALNEPEAPAVERRHLKEEFGGLTAREREVAAWIAQGRSNREIAKAMTVGVRTVETYVTRILRKLGLDSRVQIATWAIEKGLYSGTRSESDGGNP